MTLVYSRSLTTPGTHAFVIGCGRFSDLDPTGCFNRLSTVSGARKIVRFLIDNADNFIAPLASVECLLSDPKVPRGTDFLGIDEFANDPRSGSDAVDCSSRARVEAGGNSWLNRCRKGDHMFFYMASHGIVDNTCSALGLLEDVKSNPNKPWSESLNITTLATGLPIKGAAGCWVFLDACQEQVPDAMDQINGADGLSLIDYTTKQLASCISVRSCALAGSRYGGVANSPVISEPPYFTQALVRGLEGACVERSDDGVDWVVTAKQVGFEVSTVAEAAFDYCDLPAQTLTPFNNKVALLRVINPMVPIAVSTKVLSDMRSATITVDDGEGTILTKSNSDGTWRFEVPPDYNRKFTVKAEFGTDKLMYAPKTFNAAPAAQVVRLK